MGKDTVCTPLRSVSLDRHPETESDCRGGMSNLFNPGPQTIISMAQYSLPEGLHHIEWTLCSARQPTVSGTREPSRAINKSQPGSWAVGVSASDPKQPASRSECSRMVPPTKSSIAQPSAVHHGVSAWESSWAAPLGLGLHYLLIAIISFYI